MLGMRQIAALLLLAAWAGCAEVEIEPAATHGERVEVVVDVDGMVCDACSKAVVDQLKRTDGVVGSACSYQTKTAVITFDAGVTIQDFETIQAGLTCDRQSSFPAGVGSKRSRVGDSETPPRRARCVRLPPGGTTTCAEPDQIHRHGTAESLRPVSSVGRAS